MSIARVAISALICAVVALPARATGIPPQQPQHEHQQSAAKPGEILSVLAPASLGGGDCPR